MIASNTKALTTLMLAQARRREEADVGDAGDDACCRTFKLGDADTTSKVLVKHLICACTGHAAPGPRVAARVRRASRPTARSRRSATMQPTSKFGELFQYSNPLAAAAGFIGGHVAFPKLELGAAYDEAMRTRVFEPLGMKATTFDFARGADRQPRRRRTRPTSTASRRSRSMDVNYVDHPGAPRRRRVEHRARHAASTSRWSSPRASCRTASPTSRRRRCSRAARRRSRSARTRPTAWASWSTRSTASPVVHHGGDMIGFHSDMMWLPEHGVGAVILTNGDPGWSIRGAVPAQAARGAVRRQARGRRRRRRAARRAFFDAARRRAQAARRCPADAAEAAKLAARYANAALGEIAVRSARAPRPSSTSASGRARWRRARTPTARSRSCTIAPGIDGLEFVVGAAAASGRSCSATRSTSTCSRSVSPRALARGRARD